MLISELHVIKKNYLYEGLDRSSLRSVKLWESAGHKIAEAQLTANQVLQIFQQAEQGVTAAGGNRTLIGKGKDAASAVNRAWEDLKTKVQNSGPIKNVDAMYDQAAEKLKQATGGDRGVMQYVEKYRAFAKKHPVAQSLIYAALIAAAGISGAGLGGAAALGLFKMTDKLLQGEKFSSAAYAGAKTGAAAYAAGQIGKAMQGDQAAAGDNTAQAATQLAAKKAETLSDLKNLASDAGAATIKNDGFTAYLYDKAGNLTQSVRLTQQGIPKQEVLDALKSGIGGTATPEYLAKKAAQSAAFLAKNPGAANFESKQVNSIALTESQVKVIFRMVDGLPVQLNEGPMDWIKGAANKVAGAAHNITTKITANKLRDAWKKAGSPMDSDSIAAVLKSQGVADDVISSVYGQMKLPAPAANTTTASSTAQAPASVTQPTTQTTTTASDTTATTAPAGKVDSMLATLVDYVKQGGTITPKQRGAIKDLWLRIGGAQLAESKRKKNTP